MESPLTSLPGADKSSGREGPAVEPGALKSRPLGLMGDLERGFQWREPLTMKPYPVLLGAILAMVVGRPGGGGPHSLAPLPWGTAAVSLLQTCPWSELEGTEASRVPVSITVPVFKHKEEDEERSGVGGASCLSVLMPTSGLPIHVTQISDADWDDVWDRFDERPYLNAKKWRVGDDPYKLYAFNQRESERIASNRAVPDTRHSSAFNQSIYMLPSSWWLASPLPSSSYCGATPRPMAIGPH
ncbi:hypothetical protein MC885_012610 [Smutsia gigantea]|nr:hypothetical protein MC885_012610 [Smutsia gigantea]